MISEGNIGLIGALESFDPQRALRFITYAVWWIRQSILQALYNKGQLVRLPQNQQNHARGLRRNIELQERQANNSSDADELAERLEIFRDIHPELAEFLLKPQSIDAPIERDSSESLIDILPDENVLSPDVQLSAETLRYELRAAVRILEASEHCCLELLYALGSEPPLSVDEVAKRLSVPRNRVRQIRDMALVKLRRNKKIAKSLLEHF